MLIFSVIRTVEDEQIPYAIVKSIAKGLFMVFLASLKGSRCICIFIMPPIIPTTYGTVILTSPVAKHWLNNTAFTVSIIAT